MQSPSWGDAVAGVSLRVAALALAALLLVNQIHMAWHFNEGASLDAKLGAACAMLALAILPMTYELGRRVKSWPLRAGVAVVAVALLVYAVPATLSRVAAPRERDAAQATRYAALQSEYAQAKISLGEAQGWLRSCRERYQKCPADDARVTERTEQVNKLRTRLDQANAGAAGGDIGAEMISRALGVEPGQVRLVSVTAYALGVELGIFVLVALGCRRAPTPEKAPEPEPEPEPKTKPESVTATTWLAAYCDSQQENLNFEEAYATYKAEWNRRGKRVTGEDRFMELFQKEAKRRGLVVRQQGRRRLYAVA